PIAARRERTAGADLRAVGDGRALELADLKKAIEEHFEPPLDRAQVVFVALLARQQIRPGTAALVTPRVPGQIGDLARAEAMPGDIIQVEILQLIRPDLIGGLLRRFGRIARR